MRYPRRDSRFRARLRLFSSPAVKTTAKGFRLSRETLWQRQKRTRDATDNSSYRAPVRLTHDTAKWTLKLSKRSISGVCEVEALLRMPTLRLCGTQRRSRNDSQLRVLPWIVDMNYPLVP
jgi:hypothetical protein